MAALELAVLEELEHHEFALGWTAAEPDTGRLTSRKLTIV
jgi:hypothetical protein